MKLVRDSLTELGSERIRRGVLAATRLLPQLRDPRVRLDDLGEDGVLLVLRSHGQLHLPLELPEERCELFLAGSQEAFGKGCFVFEDDPESERQHRSAFERRGEDFGVVE